MRLLGSDLVAAMTARFRNPGPPPTYDVIHLGTTIASDLPFEDALMACAEFILDPKSTGRVVPPFLLPHVDAKAAR